MLKDFLAFIKRGNVLDLAVAVIIGGAFGSIVNSLVDDIIMPFLGVILKGIDFTGLALTFGDAQITYGNFIQSVVNFLIIAVAIFFLISQIKKLREKSEEIPPAPPAPSAEEKLLIEIRDILKDNH